MVEYSRTNDLTRKTLKSVMKSLENERIRNNSESNHGMS